MTKKGFRVEKSIRMLNSMEMRPRFSISDARKVFEQATPEQLSKLNDIGRANMVAAFKAGFLNKLLKAPGMEKRLTLVGIKVDRKFLESIRQEKKKVKVVRKQEPSIIRRKISEDYIQGRIRAINRSQGKPISTMNYVSMILKNATNEQLAQISEHGKKKIAEVMNAGLIHTIFESKEIRQRLWKLGFIRNRTLLRFIKRAEKGNVKDEEIQAMMERIGKPYLWVEKVDLEVFKSFEKVVMKMREKQGLPLKKKTVAEKLQHNRPLTEFVEKEKIANVFEMIEKRKKKRRRH